MSTRKKIFFIILTIILVAVFSFVAYIWFTKSKTRDPFTAIPDDAIYIIETTNLTEGWSTISDSKMWKDIRTNSHFNKISKNAASLDSLIKGNSTMDMLFSDRQMLISAHMISGNDYDFLFVVNMKQASKAIFIKDYIKSIIGVFGYTMSRRNFEGSEIIELTNDKTLEIFYFTFIDNLFVGSYSPILVERSIKQKNKNNWIKNSGFQVVSGEISSRKLFNFYFNFSRFSKFMNVYLPEENDLVNSISKSIQYSAFNVNFEDERLSFSGYTNLPDSTSSYLKALINVAPAKSNGYKIASDKSALYLSMCFENFDDFYKNLTEEFSKENNKGYENYSDAVKKVEKFFKINMHDVFFSWIGNEISFIKLKPVANAKEDDICIFIQAKEIAAAKKGMELMASQVEKRSPLKFNEVIYKNYKINYLDIKGFFKIFFGKLFGKLTKPYFTYIDDYVVFSNSPSTLMHTIDDYINGKTLAKNNEFAMFKDNFENKSNVTIFIRMPEMYSHLFYYSNAEKRKGIHDNKDLILSFSKVGLQLISNGNMFKTNIIVEHNEDELYNEQLEKFDNAAEELFLNEYDSLSFKPQLTSEQINNEGTFEIKYDNDQIKYEGNISNGFIDGNLNTFYEDGNLASSVNYKEGKAFGKAVFYYDNEDQTRKAEMLFNSDEKIDGTYTEFYENGEKKAVLEIENSKLNGDASFYYDSGNIKIEGSYKNGQKVGTWKNYTEDGNIFDKAKWKNGQQKKKSPED